MNHRELVAYPRRARPETLFAHPIRRTLLFGMVLFLFVGLLLLALVRPGAFSSMHAHAQSSTGAFTGFTFEGYTGGGLSGSYYANTTLSGTPAFTRTDVRLDFAWGSPLATDAISGSHAVPFPSNQISVKWTGQLLPRYSETYTFTTTADDGIRVIIGGQTIINDWNDHSSPDTASGTLSLTAGQKYTIEVDYYHNSGPTVAQLQWASPSTPQQVIEPANQMGIDIGAALDFSSDDAFADAIKTARDWKTVDNQNEASIDANGWPTSDAQILLWDHASMDGTYLLSFNGQASSVNANGVGYGATISALNYDATSNTTTASVVITGTSGIFSLTFNGTQRTASSAKNTGVTNVKFMHPTSEGATTSYPTTTVYTDLFKQFLTRFSVIRFMDFLATNWNGEQNWSDRNTPNWYSYEQLQNPNVGHGWEGLGAPWEYVVLLCNETGKDAYINIPPLATDIYITNIANLFKYGSDGVNPYTSPQANPVFPPLNPNLKLYMEYGNEYWNPSFSQLMQTHDEAQAAVMNNTPDGQIINYDNNNDQWTLTQRYQALRIKQTSDDFRAIFGDDAINTRIRVLYEWQYGGGWGSLGLAFLEAYYNNADGGHHVSSPHPVNYFIWGAGGGWYANLNNETGTGAVTVPDSSFETPQVSGPQQNPSGTGWTFSGNAGIATNGSSLGNGNAPDGTQVAYLQPGSSMSFSATFPQAQAAVLYKIMETSSRTASTVMKVSVDGNAVDSLSPYALPTSFDNLRSTKTFSISSGTHTITIANTDTTSTIFLDQVDFGTIDQMYQSGRKALTSVANDVKLAKSYGLIDVGYEGGFTIGGDRPFDLQAQANLDPRAKQSEIDSINEFYQDGGALPDVFDSSGYDAYGVADPDMLHQNTPKIQGLDAILQSLPPIPAPVGITVSTTGVTTITPNPDYLGDNFDRPATGSIGFYILNVTQAGTYSISITVNQFGPTSGTPGQAYMLVNGQPVGAVTSMPPSSTITFGSAPLHVGENVLEIHSVHGFNDPASTDVFYYQWQVSTINIAPGTVNVTPPPATPTPGQTPTVSATTTPTPTPGGGGWTFCANENQTCTFSGTHQVRYGANGTYFYQTATGSIACNNATFGDPVPGIVKACDVASDAASTPTPTPTQGITPTPTTSATWTHCANEGQTCTFSGTHQVRYGANGSYYYQTATGSIACNNATFGDPVVGIVKSCDYQ